MSTAAGCRFPISTGFNLIMDTDISSEIQQQLQQAQANQEPLVIVGGDSKSFYGPPIAGEPLAVAGHRGIVDYTPTELVITARCGTPLSELEAVLTEAGQMLPFEPPHFGPSATLGGTIATGLAGPRRPYAGAVRDAVLGVRCINGMGELLNFGGQVVKNVAGYDVARLMAGALGTLGVLLEASLKVIPRPRCERTLIFELTPEVALARMNRWAGQPLNLSAVAWHDSRLYVRLAGTDAGVAAVQRQLGGEELTAGSDFWTALREQQLDYFADPRPLWRLALPPAAPLLDIDGDWLIDWGGAQRWLLTTAAANLIRQAVTAVGGHATAFRRPPAGIPVFQPLAPALQQIHQRLQAAFDPAGILNRGKLFAATSDQAAA